MGRRRTLAAVLLAAALTVLPSAVSTAPAWGVDDEGLVWDVLIDGRDASTATADEPVRLSWAEPVTIDVRVRNDRPEPVRVTRVRLEGRVLGLTFFAYATEVGLELEPGEEDQRVYSLDVQDVYGQATGKLPGRVVLLDGRTEVSAIEVPVRVLAPLRSVYGTFGIGVGAVTAILLFGALWSLARGRLPANRWRRATAFALPGIGVGFTLTFTVSALGVFLPSAAVWLTLVLVCAAVGFTAGYLTPSPDDEDEDEDEIADDLDEDAALAERWSLTAPSRTGTDPPGDDTPTTDVPWRDDHGER